MMIISPRENKVISIQPSMTSAMDMIAAYHEQHGAPVEVVPLAKKFGVRVWKIDTLPDHFSGMIKKEDNGQYSIYVNEQHAEVRRRFTIAHELAHYILHFEDIGDGIFDDALYRSGLPQKKEIEANALAAKILMPWSLIKREIDELGTVNKQILAERFNVSRAAMTIRLDNASEFNLYSRVYSDADELAL